MLPLGLRLALRGRGDLRVSNVNVVLPWIFSADWRWREDLAVLVSSRGQHGDYVIYPPLPPPSTRVCRAPSRRLDRRGFTQDQRWE